MGHFEEISESEEETKYKPERRTKNEKKNNILLISTYNINKYVVDGYSIDGIRHDR